MSIRRARLRVDAIMQPSTSPVNQALRLLRWYLGSGPAGYYRVEDLEWYEVQMSASQWVKLSDTSEACDENRRYGYSVLQPIYLLVTNI